MNSRPDGLAKRARGSKDAAREFAGGGRGEAPAPTAYADDVAATLRRGFVRSPLDI